METVESIAAWAEETFGPAPSLFRVVARANEEMAELIRAVSSGQPADKVIEEAADVAIVLCRAARMLVTDISFAPLDGPGNHTASEWFLAANESIALLLSKAAEPSPFANRALLKNVVALLSTGAERLHSTLQADVDTKMAINRKRVWRKDGTGHGYHVRSKTP